MKFLFERKKKKKNIIKSNYILSIVVVFGITSTNNEIMNPTKKKAKGKSKEVQKFYFCGGAIQQATSTNWKHVEVFGTCQNQKKNTSYALTKWMDEINLGLQLLNELFFKTYDKFRFFNSLHEWVNVQG